MDSETQPLGVIAIVPGRARLSIAMELDRSYLKGDVRGESSLLVRVIRVLRRGDTHLVGDPTAGLASKMPRAERRQMSKKFDKKANPLGLNNPEIRFPGIVGTAIGIYR
jgi:hypothetical protein